MHIVPNNKLSNHYVKKRVRKQVWFENQTVSSSFRQNLGTMSEKTRMGMLYEDYLNPNISFSNSSYPNMFGNCLSMPNEDFNNSMMNIYNNNNGEVFGVEGINEVCENNNFFGGDIKGLEENNNRGCEEIGHVENGNSTINSMVDVKDANDDYADFDYPNVLDGTVNDAPWDYDNDGLTNYEEYAYNMPSGWSFANNGVWWNGTNPNDWDSDNDGLPDGYETYYGLSPSYRHRS